VPCLKQLYDQIDAETLGTEAAPDTAAVSRAIAEVETGAPNPDLRSNLGAEYTAIQSEVEDAETNDWFRARLEELDEAQLDHLAERARTSPNPYLRAQYADALIFRRKTAGELIPVAVQGFLEHATRLPPTAAERVTRSIARAAFHASRANNNRLAEDVAHAIHATIQALVGSGRDVMLPDLVEPACRLDRLVGKEPARALEQAIHAALESERRGFRPDFPRLRHLIKAVTTLRKHLKEPDAVRNGQAELAELLVLWAESEEQPLGRQVRYHEAVEFFTAAGMPQRAKDVLVLAEKNKPHLDASLTTIERQVSIPLELIERMTKQILTAESLTAALVRLATVDDLLPRVSASGSAARSAVLDLVGVATLDPGLNMAPVKTDTERDAFHAGQHYRRQLVIHTPMVTYALRRLRAEKGLTSDALLEFLTDWELMDPARLPFLESAANAYFRGDTIGFIRTINPEFEGLLRHVAKTAGLPVMKRASSGDQEYKGLRDLIALDEIRDGLGENLHLNLRMVLLADEGVAIRDNDAHAIAPAEQYSSDLADILLVLLLRLTRLALDDDEGSKGEGAPTAAE